jgi:hypothetical protein
MRLAAAAIAVIMTAIIATSASATVRIYGDPGGQIGPYIDRAQAWRDSGRMVVIDGPCLSACTLVLGIVPHNRICVTRRARLGFHAAWRPDGNGRAVRSNGGTKLLMQVYPSNIRRWIARNGGLSQRMIFLSGRELSRMYRHCN